MNIYENTILVWFFHHVKPEVHYPPCLTLEPVKPLRKNNETKNANQHTSVNVENWLESVFVINLL